MMLLKLTNKRGGPLDLKYWHLCNSFFRLMKSRARVFSSKEKEVLHGQYLLRVRVCLYPELNF